MGVWISRGNFISLLYKACAVSLYTILVRKIGGHFVTLFFNMSQNDLKLPNRILLIFSAIHIKSFAFRFATPNWKKIKNVLQYKKLFHWGYITGYPIVTIFLGVFFYNYHQWWMVLTISILMLMAILTDYFLFHYVSDRIKELTRVNKELAELKEEHKE